MSNPTGNPWIDYADSFAQADMLRRARDAARTRCFPSWDDMERIITLAIQAHDAMSVIGGGEVIELGPLPSAIIDLAGSDSDKRQVSGISSPNAKGLPRPTGDAATESERIIG